MARHGRSPELAKFGLLGANSTGIWVWDDQRAVRDRSRASSGHRNALGGDFDCGAELHGGASPERGVWWFRATPGATGIGAKGAGDQGVLT